MRFAKKYILVDEDQYNEKERHVDKDENPLEERSVKDVDKQGTEIARNLNDENKDVFDKLMEHGQLLRQYLNNIERAERPAKELTASILGKEHGGEDIVKGGENQRTKLLDERVAELKAQLISKGIEVNKTDGIRKGMSVFPPGIVDGLMKDAVTKHQTPLRSMYANR